jgi:hypothetical protein
VDEQAEPASLGITHPVTEGDVEQRGSDVGHQHGLPGVDAALGESPGGGGGERVQLGEFTLAEVAAGLNHGLPAAGEQAPCVEGLPCRVQRCDDRCERRGVAGLGSGPQPRSR